MGNSAPDVHVVSKQLREATHFFSLPLRWDSPYPWELILEKHPSLIANNILTRSQIAFMAGYLCHLQADWLWVLDIFLPAFGPQRSWSSFDHRIYLHNALRAYLDKQVYSELPPDTGKHIRRAVPCRWLPFIEDSHLTSWKKYLFEQLVPGALARTVEVFSTRQGIPKHRFYRLIESEARMDKEIFDHLPRVRLQEYRKKLLRINLRLLNNYLSNNKRPALWFQASELNANL